MYSTLTTFDPAAAMAALSGAELGSTDAGAALGLVEQAQLVSGFALAVEAEALRRLAAVYPYPSTVTTAEQRRRAVAGEVQAAFGCSQAAASARMVRSERLTELPDLLEALKGGRVDVPRALMTIDKLSVLDTADDRRAAAAVVLAAHAAAAYGLTTRQWSVLLGRAITAIDPDAAGKRQAQTRTDRGVRLHPPAVAGDEAALVIHGPTEHAAAAHAAVDTLARAWRDTGREGTLDQLRHDAAIALLTGSSDPPGGQTPSSDQTGLDEQPAPGHGEPGDCDEAQPGDGDEAPAGDQVDPERRGTYGDQPDAGEPTGGGCPRPTYSVVLNLTMGLSTLIGADEAPGELDGAGVIPAAVARGLAAQADVWRRILVDPVDGHVVTQQIRSYRPTEAMRRFVLARTGGVCAHRGCGRRADLQLDHCVPWPHGPTTALNLVPFHQGHHEDKTSGGWSYELDPETGEITQTTPVGRSYTTRPLPPNGAVAQAQPPPACGTCGSRLCPQCGSAECVPDELRSGYGCPDCASDEFLSGPPPDWTDLDEIHLHRLRQELHELTDYELIAQINAEQLAELNADASE